MVIWQKPVQSTQSTSHLPTAEDDEMLHFVEDDGDDE